MSGIVGIVSEKAGPLPGSRIHAMLDAIAHRGPEACHAWVGKSAALGNSLLRTTPESVDERLPLTSEDGRYTIAADARIDNRDEICTLVGVGPRRDRTPDSELILLAFRRFGEACVEQFVGPFAFAIWDDVEKRLFCARDHIGVKPFYYAYPRGGAFVFGSEIRAVLHGPEVTRTLDEQRLADFLIPDLDDKVRTSFRAVVRLPAAHTLTLSDGALRIRRYWQLDPDAELVLDDEREYAQAFRSALEEAVRCRTRSSMPIGSQLSGGLDSSAVTVLAHRVLADKGRLPLKTFSTTFDRVPECDERHFIQAVLEHGEFDPVFVEGDRVGPLSEWDRMMAHEDEAFTIGNYTLPWTLLRAARTEGVRVVLDGLDGDTSVWHGDAFLAELAREGAWDELVREASLLQTNNPSYYSARGLFNVYGVPQLEYLARRGNWAAVLSGLRSLQKHHGVPAARAFRSHVLSPIVPAPLKHVLRRVLRRPAPRAGSPARPATDLRSDRLVGRGQKEVLRVAAAGSRRQQWEKLNSGIFAYALETYDRVAAAHSVEARHPFMDRRFIALSLSLPPRYKLRDGWTRWIMRAAMEGVLPDEVTWRADKTDLTPNFARALRDVDGEAIDRILSEDLEQDATILNPERLRDLGRRLSAGESMAPADYNALWRGINLVLWLRREKGRQAPLTSSGCAQDEQPEAVAFAAIH